MPHHGLGRLTGQSPALVLRQQCKSQVRCVEMVPPDKAADAGLLPPRVFQRIESVTMVTVALPVTGLDKLRSFIRGPDPAIADVR